MSYSDTGDTPSATPEQARAKPAVLKWDHPFLLDQLLSEEERLIRDTAHEYCQSKLRPRAIAANRRENFHREIMSEMGELGLLGPTVPDTCEGTHDVHAPILGPGQTVLQAFQ